MADGKSSGEKSVFASIPVLLTALGGVIAALATLVTALYGAKIIGQASPTATAAPTHVQTVALVVTATPVLALATTPAPSATAAVPATSAPTLASPAPSPAATLTSPPPTPSLPPSPLPTATRPAASPTAQTSASPAPSPTPTASVVLLADDFSNPTSGWSSHITSESEAGYRNGEYRIAVYEPDYEAWSTPDEAHNWPDFVIEVDARRVEGPLDNDFGVLVRYQPDDENFYEFVISSDGQFAVHMYQNAAWKALVKWARSDAVRQGDATNHLRVTCQGTKLRFFVNGKLVAELEDATFKSGTVGLVAGTSGETGVVIHFDNLQVKALTD